MSNIPHMIQTIHRKIHRHIKLFSSSYIELQITHIMTIFCIMSRKFHFEYLSEFKNTVFPFICGHSFPSESYSFIELLALLSLLQQIFIPISSYSIAKITSRSVVSDPVFKHFESCYSSEAFL